MKITAAALKRPVALTVLTVAALVRITGPSNGWPRSPCS
jgi:hypothetical protein